MAGGKGSNKRKLAAIKAEIPEGITQREIEASKKALESKEELKRQRSNMTYALEKKGVLKGFESLTNPEKKTFLEEWYAGKLLSAGGIKALSTTQAVSTKNHKEKNYDWFNKFQILREFGDVAGKTKMETVKETRADPDSGKNDEDHKQWKIWKTTGGLAEEDKNCTTLGTDKELTGDEEIQETMNTLNSIRDNTADNRPMKQENADIEAAKTTELTTGGKPTETETKTLALLTNDSKKALRLVGDIVTNLKEILAESKNDEFKETVLKRSTILLPKMAKAFRNVEKHHLNILPGGEAGLKALSDKVDELFTEFELVRSWSLRMTTDKAKKPRTFA